MRSYAAPTRSAAVSSICSGIDDDELRGVEAALILTCQARLLTEHFVVEYDHS